MNRMGKEFLDNESGAVAVICAALLVVFCGFAALAVDYGKIVYVRRELTKAAEAGALSGARRLWPLDLSTATSYTPSWNDGKTWANTTAKANLPTPKDTDVFTDVVTVEVGRWDYVNTFTVDHVNPNGVRVTIRRNNVPTSFAQILTLNPINIERSAVAVMDFATGVGVGSLPIAVNLSKARVPGEVYIRKSTDVTDNGGWFSDELDVASANTFKNYIEKDSCPAQYVGDTINLNNGEATSALQALKDEFALHPLPEGWLVILPVVDTPKFNQQDKIESFVAYRILEVQDTGGDKYLRGMVEQLGLTTSAQPGPGNGGVPTGGLAPPKLVQ